VSLCYVCVASCPMLRYYCLLVLARRDLVCYCNVDYVERRCYAQCWGISSNLLLNGSGFDGTYVLQTDTIWSDLNYYIETSDHLKWQKLVRSHQRVSALINTVNCHYYC